MGEAKRRGTFDKRKAQAISEGRDKIKAKEERVKLVAIKNKLPR